MYRTLILLLSVLLILGCSKRSVSPMSSGSAPESKVTLTVSLGSVGALAKAGAINLQWLHYSLISAREDTIIDSTPLTSSGSNTWTQTSTLASQIAWTLSCYTTDIKGTVIHSGSTSFTLQPRQNASVTMILPARYSILRVNFHPTSGKEKDSINRCQILLDGATIGDTLLTSRPDTVTMSYDYLTASAEGVSHQLRLDVRGLMWGEPYLLYRGDTTITVVSGANQSYHVWLIWVGPGAPPTGMESFSVTFGQVGTVSIDAEVDDPGSIGMAKIPAGVIPAPSAFSGVSLTAFWMDSTEVTRGMWNQCMSLDPSVVATSTDLPVQGITFYEAILYCNARGRLNGLDTVYRYTAKRDTMHPTLGYLVPILDNLTVRSVIGYRLPTEAQWEYACRAGATTDYWWGSVGGDALTRAWYLSNTISVQQVAQRGTNPFGLYDISGNVNEWCWDWYSAAVPSSMSDPQGPVSGQYRLVRGGGWGDSYSMLKCGYRSYDMGIVGRQPDRGLRCVLPAL